MHDALKQMIATVATYYLQFDLFFVYRERISALCICGCPFCCYCTFVVPWIIKYRYTISHISRKLRGLMMLPVRGRRRSFVDARRAGAARSSIHSLPSKNKHWPGSRERIRTDSLITRAIGQLQSTLCYPGGAVPLAAAQIRPHTESAETTA